VEEDELEDDVKEWGERCALPASDAGKMPK